MPTAACDIAIKRYLIQCLRIVPSLRNPNRKEVLKMDNIVSIAPRMMTVKQLSAQTGVSEFHIRRLIKGNRITYIRTGIKYLVNYEKFVDYLNNGDT